MQVETVRTGPTAIGSAGPFTLVTDRPVDAGGGGLGFNGGQLLNLAVAACVSNDLYREAAARGIHLSAVKVTVDSGYEGDASPLELGDLIRHVDAIAEIPNSLRGCTAVSLTRHGSISRSAG